MHAHQILIGKRRGPRASLGCVVRVEIAGCSTNIDALPAEEHTHATHEVHGTDDGAAFTVDFRKRTQMRGAPLAPEPDLRGGLLAARLACLVDRVFAKDFATSLHQVSQHGAAWAFRQMGGNWLIWNVVRWLRPGLFRERCRPFAAIHEDIAIADARVKFQAGRRLRAWQ